MGRPRGHLSEGAPDPAPHLSPDRCPSRPQGQRSSGDEPVGRSRRVVPDGVHQSGQNDGRRGRGSAWPSCAASLPGTPPPTLRFWRRAHAADWASPNYAPNWRRWWKRLDRAINPAHERGQAIHDPSPGGAAAHRPHARRGAALHAPVRGPDLRHQVRRGGDGRCQPARPLRGRRRPAQASRHQPGHRAWRRAADQRNAGPAQDQELVRRGACA